MDLTNYWYLEEFNSFKLFVAIVILMGRIFIPPGTHHGRVTMG